MVLPVNGGDASVLVAEVLETIVATLLEDTLPEVGRYVMERDLPAPEVEPGFMLLPAATGCTAAVVADAVPALLASCPTVCGAFGVASVM